MWLLDEGGHSCAKAFIKDNEFAHVHPSYDGSMHMMLPEDVAHEVVQKGWGEPHPLVPEGRMPPTLVMVFGPRDEAELNVVLQLVDASYKFARGV